MNDKSSDKLCIIDIDSININLIENKEKKEYTDMLRPKHIEDDICVSINPININTKIKLGNGSYGSVYKIDDNDALKIFHNKDIKSSYNQDLLKEINCNMLFRETKLVPYMKQVVINRMQTGYLMEKCKCDLHDLVFRDGFKFDINSIKTLIVSVICILSTAEKMNILYRDLKPKNILLGTNNLFKLADWGLSGWIINERIKTDSKIVQTLWYRSPEHLLEIKELMNNPSIDMWSFGIILLEIITNTSGIISARTERKMIEKLINFFGMPNNQKMLTKLNEINIKIEPNKVDLEKICLLSGFDNLFADFLKKLLDWNPEYRLTPSQAIRHPFLIAHFEEDILINYDIFSDMYYPRSVIDLEYIKENNKYYYANRYDIILKITNMVDIIGKKHELSLLINYLDRIASIKPLLSNFEILRFAIIIVCIIESYINDDEYEYNVIEYYCNIFEIPVISYDDVWIMTSHILDILSCELTTLTPQICLDIFSINNQTYFSKELVRTYYLLTFIQSLNIELIDIDPASIFQTNMLILKNKLSEKQNDLIKSYDSNKYIYEKTIKIINNLKENSEFIEFIKGLNYFTIFKNLLEVL